MLKTGITNIAGDDIVVRGRRLAEDLVGKISFSDFIFFHARGRMPSDSESVLFGALLVNSMDHGINLPVLTARLTYGGAPDAIQGAIAAGILGVGRVGDGAIETVASTLYGLAAKVDGGATEEEAVEAFINEKIEKGGPIAGLGHAYHKTGDPRVNRLFELAEEHKVSGRYIRLLKMIAVSFSARKGKSIPINGAGAVAALYCELEFPAPFAKAATIVALSAGVAGHLMEEIRQPMAREIRNLVAKNVVYTE